MRKVPSKIGPMARAKRVQCRQAIKAINCSRTAWVGLPDLPTGQTMASKM